MARAGVADDAGTARFDGDQRRAERAGYFKLAFAAQIDFRKNAALLPDDGAIGHAALPEQRHAEADEQGAEQHDQPVARPDQGQPAHLAAGQRAVADEHAGPGGEFAGQPFGQINRAMLAAGAADGDRQVIAVVADVTG